MKKYIIFAVSVLCAASCAENTTIITDSNTLYNGIQIPEQWPPRYEEPAEAGVMPVPYLDNKPEVININVGRQLFVDNFLIAETNMTQTCHTPNVHEKPVLEPTEEWELTRDGAPYAAPFSDGIWYDESVGKYKMWYLAGAGSIHKETNQTFYTCYAESEDGKEWTKPIQEIYEGTNVVDTKDRDAATIWMDKSETDPAKRFKMFNVERRPTDRRWQFMLKYSPDGIHWSEPVAQSGDMYDRSSAFYNPFRKKWCLSMRYSTEVSSRSRSYIEHSDPEMAVSLAHRVNRGTHDKHVVYWFTPDKNEPRHPRFPEVDPGIYNFDCMAYESLMIGQYAVWLGPENHICAEEGIQKRNELMLGYSRDGFHFSRPSYKPFISVNEVAGAWNYGNVQSANGTPVVVGDSLYFYVSGRRLNDIMWDSYTSTGFATLRRDGFVSMDAKGKDSYLTTEKLVFDGKYMFVNANVKGELAVEILDADGNPIKGFTKADCNVIKTQDATKIAVSWGNNNNLSKLAGDAVKVKFHISDGELFAFWVSPWESGESRGYINGGPGIAPKGVDEPIQ